MKGKVLRKHSLHEKTLVAFWLVRDWDDDGCLRKTVKEVIATLYFSCWKTTLNSHQSHRSFSYLFSIQARILSDTFFILKIVLTKLNQPDLGHRESNSSHCNWSNSSAQCGWEPRPKIPVPFWQPGHKCKKVDGALPCEGSSKLPRNATKLWIICVI